MQTGASGAKQPAKLVCVNYCIFLVNPLTCQQLNCFDIICVLNHMWIVSRSFKGEGRGAGRFFAAPLRLQSSSVTTIQEQHIVSAGPAVSLCRFRKTLDSAACCPGGFFCFDRQRSGGAQRSCGLRSRSTLQRETAAGCERRKLKQAHW